MKGTKFVLFTSTCQYEGFTCFGGLVEIPINCDYKKVIEDLYAKRYENKECGPIRLPEEWKIIPYERSEDFDSFNWPKEFSGNWRNSSTMKAGAER